MMGLIIHNNDFTKLLIINNYPLLIANVFTFNLLLLFCFLIFEGHAVSIHGVSL